MKKSTSGIRSLLLVSLSKLNDTLDVVFEQIMKISVVILVIERIVTYIKCWNYNEVWVYLKLKFK